MVAAAMAIIPFGMTAASIRQGLLRGLGLGLSKCWRIVSLHGGRIDVESEPSKGTTFIIRLPEKADEVRQAKGA